MRRNIPIAFSSCWVVSFYGYGFIMVLAEGVFYDNTREGDGGMQLATVKKNKLGHEKLMHFSTAIK